MNKNIIYGIVIVGCIVLAGVIFWWTSSGDSGNGQIPAGQKTWVICLNPKCKAVYQMEERQYDKELKELMVSGMPGRVAALKCKQCGKKTLFRAIKCDKCGNVFRESSIPNDYSDRCPKCKYSRTEAARKARAGGGS